jgi:myo-inositol-1(or 4)-monophosphatase
MSEESHASVSVKGYTWVIDPLDGTNNYVFGIPFFCVNIALVKDNDVLLGVTYDPLTREMFHAISGGGAYLNGRAIHVAKKQSLEKGLVGFDIGYNVGKSEMTLGLARTLRAKVHSLRVLGSASLGLAYVASGRFDLYFHPYLYPWDVASGVLLVSEAGGLVTDWSGRSAGIMDQEFIAGNEAMRTQFAGFLNSGNATFDGD